MPLARCKRHFDRERLRRFGYVEYIPARQLPDIVVCGAATHLNRDPCARKAAIVLKEGERGVLYFYTHSVSLNIENYHKFIIPL
jgi:hypothetical protein